MLFVQLKFSFADLAVLVLGDRRGQVFLGLVNTGLGLLLIEA
jgi:hypothetical protein